MQNLRSSSLRAGSEASYAVTIGIGLILFEGLRSLIFAASLPLERLSVIAINALLTRGWRNVILLSEPPLYPEMVGYYAFIGIVLMTLGLLVGAKFARPSNIRP